MAAGRNMAATAMQNQRERQKMGGMGGGRAGGGGNGEMADMMRQMADRLDGGQGNAQGQIQKAAGVLRSGGAS